LGEFARLVEVLSHEHARRNDEEGSASEDAAVAQRLVEELRRHKVELVEARERAALAPDADRQADRVSALREELLGRQRQLRSLLPRPSEGDSVLVCSANAVGTVEAAGGKGADYRIILPSGISSLLPEGDLLLQSEDLPDERWNEMELRASHAEI